MTGSRRPASAPAGVRIADRVEPQLDEVGAGDGIAPPPQVGHVRAGHRHAQGWVDIMRRRQGLPQKKSLFNRWAEEARKLARRAVAGQAKAVASSEVAQYHRHVKVHTSAARAEPHGARTVRVIANMDD